MKDIDFARREITVRDGKGRKDRITMLPSPLEVPLRRHLAGIAAQHTADRKAGMGTVELPGVLRAGNAPEKLRPLGSLAPGNRQLISVFDGLHAVPRGSLAVR